MLKAAVLVANTVDREGRPVLVHCSDGWDRTPQIVALAKILLDPYYRTLEVLRGLGREVLRGLGRERAGRGELEEVLSPRICLGLFPWRTRVAWSPFQVCACSLKLPGP